MSPERGSSKRSSRLQDSYTPLRRSLYQVVTASQFETAVGIVITLNFVSIVLEANIAAACESRDASSCIPLWIEVLNYVFLGLYSMEAALRIYVRRIQYFKSAWDIFDFLIVLIGYVDIVLAAMAQDDNSGVSGMQMLRVFRVARLMRATRMLRIFPELHAMVRGFISAMSAMLWGFIMIVLLLLMWSVLAVELYHSMNKELHPDDEYCANALGSVFSAMLLFFQTLMAGDSWGVCAIPLIRKAPSSILVFAGSLITIQLGFTNLILAVIVERAQEAHDDDKQQQVLQQNKRRNEAEARLREMCQDVDSDGDGRISLDELLDAYDEHEDLRAVLLMLDIDKDDLECLFHLMDVDDSGDLTFEELINCIHKSDNNDLKRQMMMIKLQVEDVWLRVRDHMQAFPHQVLANTGSAAPAECLPTTPHSGSTPKLRGAMLRSATCASSASTIGHGHPAGHAPGGQSVDAMPGMDADQKQAKQTKDAKNVEVERRQIEVGEAALPPKDLETAAAIGKEFDRIRRRLDDELQALAKSVLSSEQEGQEPARGYAEVAAARGSNAPCHSGWVSRGGDNHLLEPGHWDNAQSLWGVRSPEVQLHASPEPKEIPGPAKAMRFPNDSRVSSC